MSNVELENLLLFLDNCDTLLIYFHTKYEHEISRRVIVNYYHQNLMTLPALNDMLLCLIGRRLDCGVCLAFVFVVGCFFFWGGGGGDSEEG